MYWNVPRMVPRAVSGWLSCTSVGRLDAPEIGRAPAVTSDLARPKSSSFTPDFVEHDVAGLQVPVDDALPMRLVERVGDLDAVAQDLLGRQRAFAEAVGERLALEVLHDEVVGVALAPDVVERADVRMRELRDRLRLALEAMARLLAGREVGGENLDGDGRARAACRAPCRPLPSRRHRWARRSRRALDVYRGKDSLVGRRLQRVAGNRRIRRRHRRDALAGAPAPQDDEERRHEEHREAGRGQHAGRHRESEGPAGAGAGAFCEQQRQNAQDEREARS